jgi:hypothetical protein
MMTVSEFEWSTQEKDIVKTALETAIAAKPAA